MSARKEMGIMLAQKVRRQLSSEDLECIDCVIPIPETSSIAARVCAEHMGKPLADAFVKNRYVFRTFIMPTQKHRRTGVKRKLNAIQGEFAQRNVLLVDDSIVRGTTSRVSSFLWSRICRGPRAEPIVF